MPWGNEARVPQPVLGSPGAATEEACVPRAHALQQEKPLQRGAPVPALRK